MANLIEGPHRPTCLQSRLGDDDWNDATASALGVPRCSCNRCHAPHVGADGFEFSCDLDQGHAGLHRAEDYDIAIDAFRTAEWTGTGSTEWIDTPPARSDPGPML